MASVNSSALQSYGDVSRRDSILNLVEIISPTENYFLTNLGKTVATDGVHYTMLDTLATAGTGAITETADYSYNSLTTPTRLANIVELVATPFAVSMTQQWIQKWTMEDELTRQTTKALLNWGNSVEYDLMQSTLVSGVSGTAPKMDGIVNHISKTTNYTAQTSGTVFSASILKGLLQGIWVNANNNVATDVFLGGYMKSVFDTFTAGQTKFVMAKEAEISDFTDVYDSGGFGRIRVHLHRYLNISGTTTPGATANTGNVLILTPERHKIAYLKEPFIDDPARSGPYTPRAVVGSMTLETRNQDLNSFATGYYDVGGV